MPEVKTDLLERIRKKLTVENLDPGDKLLGLLTPGMMVEHQQRYRFAAGLFKLGDTILDAASGRGYGSGMMGKFGFNVLGVDLKNAFAKEAKEKYGSQAQFGVANVIRLPLAADSVDGVTAFEITEHLTRQDQPSFIEEIARILRERGVAVISIPHRYSDRLTGNVFHLYEPSPEELKTMIKEAGLELVDEKGQVECEQEEAAELRGRLNKPLNKITLKMWQKKQREVEEFFKVVDVPRDPGKTTLTHIFVAKKPAKML